MKFFSVLVGILASVAPALAAMSTPGFLNAHLSRTSWLVTAANRSGPRPLPTAPNMLPDAASLLADAQVAAAATPLTRPAADSHATDIAVFIVGLIPFAWATVEFWRRIAVGASFGTGQDSVVIIGDDDDPAGSRGRRVLGKGALAIAYVLFGIAALSIGIAVYSVVVSPDMPT